MGVGKTSITQKLEELQSKTGMGEYNEYRKCAKRLDNDINQRALNSTNSIFAKLSESMDKNDFADVEIGDRTFIMQKDKDGKTTYSVKIPGVDEPQVMDKNTFREAVRVETRKDIAKNIDYEI